GTLARGRNFAKARWPVNHMKPPSAPEHYIFAVLLHSLRNKLAKLPASRATTRKLAATFVALLVVSLGSWFIVLAAIPLSTTTPSTQNLDGLGSTATATLPADFKVDKQTSARTVGTFAAATTATERVGGANLSTTAANGIYNFGSGTTSTGGADRAVGFL